MKKFGTDDFDALKALNQKIEICCITGDKKGFPIVEKRIKEEMLFPLFLVSHKPLERWQWIKENYKDKGYTVIFAGDGIYDYKSLAEADLSFTVKNALDHVKNSAVVVVNRNGAERFIAEVCIRIDKYYNLKVPEFEEMYE